ncbi:lipase [Listeria newyorkensis]|uniref:Lipase n=1 Tax=Listeria newyorkensis TaxID=1497681 RepID=A0ABX4XJF4_9LIST|nr:MULTISPECIES: alpha/beta hydrolase [Listeria]KGL46495.1 lipase [Listeriaceae bacterium FSL A5-0209]KGL46782.1 lipase [Listeria newyorkensis]PNP87490.1 lipase [Listeria newyorkensis]RQW66756.1 alpha/beta hydrolase [Listeria sp. SHR_NRA_18]WAO20522.1 alpha/beta hydrolase [Listeria newyorkensis]
MKQTLKWIGIVLVSIVLLPLVAIFFIYKKATGKREYDPKVLDNLEEAAQDYVKKTAPLSDVDSRYKYIRLAEKALPAAKNIEVGEIENKKIDGPGGKISLRIYSPEADGPYPLMVYFHGGGFVTGSVQSTDGIARKLVQTTGYRVISVDYRLAPENPFPAAIEDAYATVAWVSKHLTSLRAKSKDIVVAGDSAGGNIAAVVAQLAKSKGTPNISKQILLYPPVDIFSRDASVLYPSMDEFAEGYVLTKESLDKYFKLYLSGAGDRKYDPLVAPIRHKDVSDLPAAFVATAEYDPLRDQGEAYAEKLKDAGVPVYAKRLEKVPHGFMSTPSAATDETYELISEFLQEKL